MLLEISCASDFLSRFLSASSSITPQVIEAFKEATVALMTEKYTNHWDPQRPHMGNGYRAITSFGGQVDPLLCKVRKRPKIRLLFSLCLDGYTALALLLQAAPSLRPFWASQRSS